MSFGKAKGGGRRKSARTEAPVLGTLSTIGRDYRVALVNLSSTGVRLSAPDLPVEGEEVMFSAENVHSYGFVVWVHGGQCGVSFESPMPASDVDRLRNQPSIWILGMPGPEERAAAQEWHLGISP